MAENRRQRGLKVMARIHGRPGKSILDKLDAIAPDFKRLIIDSAFGEVYARPGLDLKTREAITVAVLVAQGNTGDILKAHIHGAIHVGNTRKQVVEIIMQTALYGGFQNALHGLLSAAEVFREIDAENPAARRRANAVPARQRVRPGRRSSDIPR